MSKNKSAVQNEVKYYKITPREQIGQDILAGALYAETWETTFSYIGTVYFIGKMIPTSGPQPGKLLNKKAAISKLDDVRRIPVKTLDNGITLNAADKIVKQKFKSYSAFKRYFGPAGKGKAWHHIVEQNPANLAKFGPEAIHNTGNLMKLPHGAGSIHSKISGFYSSIQPKVTGSTTMTVRQWLSTKSFQFQYDFGIMKLTEYGWKF